MAKTEKSIYETKHSFENWYGVLDLHNMAD